MSLKYECICVEIFRYLKTTNHISYLTVSGAFHKAISFDLLVKSKVNVSLCIVN
jgi:hypothetical protein